MARNLILSEDILDQCLVLQQNGATIQQLADLFGVTRGTMKTKLSRRRKQNPKLTSSNTEKKVNFPEKGGAKWPEVVDAEKTRKKVWQAEALLSSIPELVVMHLPRSERCCGGAGIYGISQRRLSHELLKEKLEETQEAEARFVVTANPGCLMQIGAGAMTNRQSFAVVHAIEVLDEALVRL